MDTEEVIFFIKQQVLSKPILLKPLQDKQKRLVVLHESSQQLEISLNRKPIIKAADLQATSTISDWTKAYFEQKSSLKTQFSNADHPLDCVEIIDAFLALERQFTTPFEGFNWCEDQPVFGKDLDAMLFIRFLKAQQELGRNTIEELNLCKSELPVAFLLDLKRLSLLKNYL